MMDGGNTALNATLVNRIDLGRELAIVRVQPDAGEIPEFEPGQFLELALPSPPRPEVELATAQLAAGEQPRRARMTRRAYSLASAKVDRKVAEFYIVLVERGRLTPRIWPLVEGDRLWMDTQPRGHFTLDDVPRGSDVLAIATGTGVAPYVSMLRTYRATGRWRRFVLVHGVRVAADLGYRSELQQMAAQSSDFLYLPVLSREPANSGWTGLRGRAQVALDEPAVRDMLAASRSTGSTHVLLCGNPEMISQTQAKLTAQGFVPHTRQQPGNLHVERYW
jgi:ferredoxin/flavodoxin---NADP+ reductase